MCFVTDLVDGLARLMSSDPDVTLVNFGSEDPLKMVAVAKKIIEMTNSRSQIVFENPLLFLTKRGTPDLKRAKEELGWLPLIRLEEGLRLAIDYTIANKEALV